MKFASVIIAAALATAASAPAMANPSAVAVKYADLDLSTESGQAQLARRIDDAARQACGVEESRTGTRLPSRSQQQCFKEAKSAVSRAIAERTGTTAPKG